MAAMQFDLTDEQRQIQEMARAFTAEARRAAFATAPLTDLIAEVVLAATWAPP